MAIWQEKEIEGLQIGKEELKWFLFADGIILYTKDAEEHTQTEILLELISQFSKVRDKSHR